MYVGVLGSECERVCKFSKIFLHVQISPRQGFSRVRELTLAEIEHFVDPKDKSHPKFSEVKNLEFLMFPREEQMSAQSAKKIRLGEAVSRVGSYFVSLYHFSVQWHILRSLLT